MQCSICNTNKTEETIFETTYWRVILGDEQSYLGRCLVILKRHEGELSKLTVNEYEEFFTVIKKLEQAIKKAFGAEMFNWSCLMNNAYQKNPPNPHIHWHFIPRYRRAVEFEKQTFEDPDFAHHYERNRKFEVSEEIRRKIIEKITKTCRSHLSAG